MAAAATARVERIDRLTGRDAMRWQDLLQRQAAASPFLSYGFCRTVHDVRGGIWVLVTEQAGEAVGFLPFELRPGGFLLGHAGKVGRGMSDAYAPVGALPPGGAAQVLRAAGLSALRFDHLPDGALPFAADETESTTGVHVRIADFAAFSAELARRDKDFVREVRRQERRVAEDLGPLRFDWQAAGAPDMLDRVIEAKRLQYRRTGVADALGEPWRRALLHGLLQARHPGCQLIVSTLHAGTTWLASNVSLVGGEVVHIWFPVYEQAHRRYGPGHLLFLKIFAHAAGLGYRMFDFGQGSAAYKTQYLGEEYALLKGVIRRPSPAGMAEKLLQSALWRLEAAKKRKAARAGGPDTHRAGAPDAT